MSTRNIVAVASTRAACHLHWRAGPRPQRASDSCAVQSSRAYGAV